ncbi:hypothetical protein Poly51_06180 [Rubripirellula tenax]|uniref:Uncharacterized protein n=1 Tax=Rubripirellula tenax TaxID=2528015 RepID=A0A5C6FIC7_9BACT|nr:hypothetical protein Poly51_06180 [Rubripirellula tenax]
MNHVQSVFAFTDSASVPRAFDDQPNTNAIVKDDPFALIREHLLERETVAMVKRRSAPAEIRLFQWFWV